MIRTPQPKVARRYHPVTDFVRTIEIHEIDCTCETCEPYVPADPDRLTASDMGALATLGAITGTVIGFMIDPAGAAAALLATIGF